MYRGYNFKIENNTFPNSVIVPGSYQFEKSKRIAKSRKDANGITKNTYYPKDKVVITFSIKERTSAQQETIKWLFRKKENVSISYFDDETQDYATGSFRLIVSSLKHSFDGDDVYYAQTSITLEEY